MKNVTDSIIDDVLKNGTNTTNCLLSIDCVISINQINNRAVINATIVVCNQETQKKLSVDIENNLQQDFINSVQNAGLLQIDEIDTKVGIVIIYEGEVSDATSSPKIIETHAVTKSDDDMLMMVIYIAAASVILICCIIGILICKCKDKYRGSEKDKEINNTTMALHGITMTEIRRVKSKSVHEDPLDDNNDMYIQTAISTPSGIASYETNGGMDILQPNNIRQEGSENMDEDTESDEDMYKVNDEIVTPKDDGLTANGETVQ